MKSKAWALNRTKELASYISEEAGQKAEDTVRPWHVPHDALLAHLPPGFLFQKLADLSWHKEDKTWRIFELKTMVVWGRAYFAELRVDNEGKWNGKRTMFLRGQKDGELDYYDPTPGIGSTLWLHKLFGHQLAYPSWNWILRERHLECVWALSERISRILAVDCVRADIFITRGKPNSCMVNEISLSSGYVAGDAHSHRLFAGRLWADVLLTTGYDKVIGNASSPPAYLFALGSHQ